MSAVPFASAIGADVPADAHIDRVTVYRQGAMVARVAQIALPAGTHRVIFRGLPAGVDPQTLQISVDNAGVQVGGIEVARINEPNFVSEPERELRSRYSTVFLSAGTRMFVWKS